MEPISGFCDLCVLNTKSSPEILKQTCLQLQTLGYRSIAINQFVEENAVTESKKKKKKDPLPIDPVPLPVDVDFLKVECKNLRIYKRLTIKLSDGSAINKFNQSTNIRKYDLIAVLPTTQSALQIACSNFDVDIICFDSEDNSSTRITRKLYRQATARGLAFELMYSPAILDSTRRRHIIHTAHCYHACGKSRSIVISSWAEDPLQVRSPYDIINLALILGLSEEQAKCAVSRTCRDILLKAIGRKNGKTLVFVVSNKSDDKEASSQEDSDMEMIVDKLKDDIHQPLVKKAKQSNE